MPKTKKKCKHPDGCELPHRAKGYCALHYGRALASLTGDPGPLEKLTKKPKCKHPDGCPRDNFIGGWCSMHIRRVQNSPSGDPGPAEPLLDLIPKSCCVKGCLDLPVGNHYCGRHYGLSHRYSLSVEQMFKYDQTNHCTICGDELIGGSRSSKSKCLDHDHNTEAVRGVLCSHCNRGLGFFKDDPEMMQKAISFLLNPPGL